MIVNKLRYSFGGMAIVDETMARPGLPGLCILGCRQKRPGYTSGCQGEIIERLRIAFTANCKREIRVYG